MFTCVLLSRVCLSLCLLRVVVVLCLCIGLCVVRNVPGLVLNVFVVQYDMSDVVDV